MPHTIATLTMVALGVVGCKLSECFAHFRRIDVAFIPFGGDDVPSSRERVVVLNLLANTSVRTREYIPAFAD